MNVRSVLLAAILVVLAGVAFPALADFNVKDFGAKGDGKADDTKAIQDAFDAAAKTARSEQYPGHSYYVSNAEIYFPSGKYIITDTLQIKANVRGEGGAIIYLENSKKDIMAGDWVWRWKIEGITFVGGRDQLHIGNPNIDTGRIIIEQCSFYNCDGIAVNLLKGTNSTQVTVEDCVFLHCRQAVVNWCDLCKVKDTWVSTKKEMQNQAAFENHGWMVLDNICGVPIVVPENDQRWIDNYGSVTCRDFRFGGESAGFTCIVNFAPYVCKYPVQGPSITIDSCFVAANGNKKRRCAIYLEAIPNQIVVTKSWGFCDIPIVVLDEKVDVSKFTNEARNRPDGFRYLIGEANHEIIRWYNGLLPEAMMPYQANEVVLDAPPKAGYWRRGQFVRNRNVEGTWGPQGYVKKTTPAAAEPYGWYCVESGDPGTWQPMPLGKMITRDIQSIIDRQKRN
jgi:hypothetical protein